MPNKLIKANDGSLIGNSFFAVGSIQQSFLDATEFESIMGTDWVFADGRDVSGSLYETITGNSTVPDCRGLFLRTVGGNADPAIGGTQTDEVIDHIVRCNNTGGSTTQLWFDEGTGSRVPSSGRTTIRGVAIEIGQRNQTSSADITSTRAGDDGAAETRPANITVNTFIKIN